MIKPYKIFIFESNTGKLLRTEDYSDLLNIQKEIIDYNKENLDNRLNIYFGTDFPPKGVKYNLEIKQFVNKTLSEQYNDGEIQIPPDMKIVNDVLVRLTKKELYDKGLISLEHDEKIDEFDNIVKLTKKEMYDLGKITKYQVYDYFLQELNLKVEAKLKNFYNYPMQEMGTWQYKKDQGIKWLVLNLEEKINIINSQSILMYDLLISEASIESLSDINEKIEKIDFLANKVIAKYSELEKLYGEMFAIRSNTKEIFKQILQKDKINHYVEMEKELNKII